MTTNDLSGTASVDLYWLPLGAGRNTRCVRLNGRLFEAISACIQHRERRDLYHAAMEVRLDGERYVIEMTPAWGTVGLDREVVCEGPVGLRTLGRSRLFRYEVRRWRDGVIPDLAEAVGGPRRIRTDSVRARRMLELVQGFPTATWGRDELDTGDMWNSNSLVAWLLARSGHEVETLAPPPGGRAPGWSAGVAVAARPNHRLVRAST